jgi:cruciform cutting endonuclease 1
LELRDQRMSRKWLHDLKLEQLQRLATLVGSNCSGRKSVRIDGIEAAIEDTASLVQSIRPVTKHLSIVSIDMGIRNLAYCNLKTPAPQSETPGLSSIRLDSWRRVVIAQSSRSPKSRARLGKSNTADEELDRGVMEVAMKESFEPEVYAQRAYNFIKYIIDEHNPSHVLIERQRFRSGGQAAVQEWTIRVGVFEAMLYASLRTLVEQKYCDCTIVPVSPSMVNRFWLTGTRSGAHATTGKTTANMRVKKEKIKLAGGLLASKAVEFVPITFSNAADTTKAEFLSKLNKEKNADVRSMPKLDDLSDCFLQGLAWISWQRNRLRIASSGEKAFDLKS